MHSDGDAADIFHTRPVKTIKRRALLAYVVAEPCIGTKDNPCVEVCPVDAIYPEDMVPHDWRNYIELNAAHFREKQV